MAGNCHSLHEAKMMKHLAGEPRHTTWKSVGATQAVDRKGLKVYRVIFTVRILDVSATKS
jgi:hypothetical protein